MNKRETGTLYPKMIIAALVPVLIMCVLMLFVVFGIVEKASGHEVHTELANVVDIIQISMERAYPGDYKKVGNEKIAIYKGEHLLNDDFEFIDQIKESCNVDVTIFYENIRIISTIKDKNSERVIGTYAHVKVENEVLNAKKSEFYDNIIINEKEYYGYYKPLFNSDGSCVGMIFAGKPVSEVRKYTSTLFTPVLVVSILGLLLVIFVSCYSTSTVVGRIKKVDILLNSISNGKLDNRIESDLLNSNDEIGRIFISGKNMQDSLRKLIEMDVLTQINNRRSGENKLIQSIKRAEKNGTRFSVAICDIDFFKKVNDTYGHDVGDEVLVKVAGILNQYTSGKGFVARWGGEEFLIVFDRAGVEAGAKILEEILNSIRDMEILVKGSVIKVTMSFGIVEGECNTPSHLLVKEADKRLYYAKSNGRNRIVDFEVPEEFE